MRAVLYTRYSSHNQRDVSIDQQIHVCEAFAKDLDAEIVDIYSDRALTGTNDKRPRFQKMISDAEKRLFDVIIVYSLDRFSRDRYDSAVYKRKLKQLGVKVMSATERITDDATGVLLESMLEGLAEYYSLELARKINRGMEDNATKCIANGPLPFGYKKGADSHYEIDEDRAPVVREIFRRVADGDQYMDIARDLNARGYRTYKGNPWGRGSFVRMLTNERYRGVYLFRDIRVENGIPRIVDDDLFFSVQKRLKKEGTKVTEPRNSEYLLTGKLFCGECRSPMTGTSGTSKSGRTYYYYFCTGKKKGCRKHDVRRDLVEQAVFDAIRDNVLMNDEVIQWIADSVIKYYEQNDNTGAEIALMRARKAEIEISINNIVKAIEAGVFSSSTNARLQQLESDSADLAAKIASAEIHRKKVNRDDILAWLDSFRHGDFSDPDFTRTLFDSFLSAVYLFDDGRLTILFTCSDDPLDLSLLSDFPPDECSYMVNNGRPNVDSQNTIYFVNGIFLILSTIKREAR